MRIMPPAIGRRFEIFAAVRPSSIPTSDTNAVVIAITVNEVAMSTFINDNDTPTASASILVAIPSIKRTLMLSGARKFWVFSSSSENASRHILTPSTNRTATAA